MFHYYYHNLNINRIIELFSKILQKDKNRRTVNETKKLLVKVSMYSCSHISSFINDSTTNNLNVIIKDMITLFIFSCGSIGWCNVLFCCKSYKCYVQQNNNFVHSCDFLHNRCNCQSFQYYTSMRNDLVSCI